MNTEINPPPPSSSVSTEQTHPVSIPLFLTSSSSSLKPLRERNRTNLKRRINLSRSQVLSNDFENEDNLSTTTNINKTTAPTTTSSQTPSTPTIHTHTEHYSKTISPKTPSPIHTTVTCSQVWERLASNDEHQNPISPKPIITPTTSTSSLPTHISFSYDPSDNEDEGDDLPHEDKDDFQYVPVSSQSKLVQFQFLTFARQQQFNLNNDDENEKRDNDNQEDTIITQNMQEDEEENDDDEDDEEEEQENRTTNKRKRSVSTTNSLDDIPPLPNTITTTNDATESSSSTTKPPRSKKPKIKDPNANFQRLNMRKKNFSHGKKHQFGRNKRNAFYRRMRNAGGN